MGEYADDAWDPSDRFSWFERRRFVPQPAPKPKNSQVFAKFARDGVNFKTGDRVVHIPSGTSGVVWGTRNQQILWRPDSRIKKGGIWVDADKFRFDI